MKPIIIAIAGPSGAGKSYMADILKKENSFQEIVSTTTRNPREGEINGVHYHFVNHEDFEKMNENNDLIEYSKVNGNFYGVSKNEPLRLAKSGGSIVLVAEPEGVENIKKYCKEKKWHCLTIFVSSPMEVLLNRLNDRMNTEIDKIDPNTENYENKILKIKESSDKRVDHIKNFEFKNWVEPAYSKNSIFDVVFDEFNNKNQKEIMKTITDRIKKIRKIENKFKP